MALTATPQSALSRLDRDPAWDESIVPALRKRLETESHALSKRMSAASIVTASDTHHNHPNPLQSFRDAASTPTSSSPRPSAIPRPSLQYARPGQTEAQGGSGRSSSASGKFHRNRTYSQPFPFDQLANSGAESHPVPGLPSRSDSPMTSNTPVKTRIPISRARTGSSASTKQPGFGNGPNGVGNGNARTRTDSKTGYSKGTASNFYSTTSANDPMLDLYPLSEAASSIASRSALRTPRSQASQLIDEPPPFTNVNSTSSRWGGGYDSVQSRGDGGRFAKHVYDEFASPRMSTDSEERPFEHWYRGDVSRNGGVGELRVGRKQEMLDIANYGHALRQASRNVLGTNSRSRSNSRGREIAGMWGDRPRSGSVGARPGRESVLFDEDAARASRMMFDEQPPTDIDSDSEGHGSRQDSEYGHHLFMSDHMQGSTLLSREPLPSDPDDSLSHEDLRYTSASPPLSLARSDTPTTLVDASKSSAFKSRIPTPTPRQISEATSARSDSTSFERERDAMGPTVGRATPTPQTPIIAPQEPAPRPSVSSARTTSTKSVKSAKAPVLHVQTQIQSKASTGTPKSSDPKTPAQPTPNSAGANKRRAKSPASPKVANKKTRTKSPAAKPNQHQKDESGKEIVQYPATGEEGDMAFAIPVWTQPVTVSGNWDDVVIPVVARKQGLDGHFEQADGTPKPRPPPPAVVTPAPGTFGFDWRKSQRRSMAPDDFELDEFGHRIEQPSVSVLEPERPEPPEPPALQQPPDASSTSSSDDTQPPSPKPQVSIKLPQPSPSPVSPRSTGSQKRPESPAPFSHYTTPPHPVPVPHIQVTRPSGESPHIEMKAEPEENTGCCKCVIM